MTIFLHITADNTEERFRRKPDDRPTLTVETFKRGKVIYERTWTVRAPTVGSWVTVPPRGDGWTYEAPVANGSDSWTRTKKKRAPE